MTRTLRGFGLALLLSAVLTAPARTGEPLTDGQKLDLLLRDVAALKSQVGALSPEALNLRFERMQVEIDLIKAQLQKVPLPAPVREAREYSPQPLITEPRPVAAAATEADCLRMKLMQTEIDLLRGRLERAAARRDSVARAFDPVPVPIGTGTLELTNNSNSFVTVRINGVSYSVPPRTSRSVMNHPTGSFTYEVWAQGYGVIQPPQSRILSANQTYPITVNAPLPVLDALLLP